MDDICRICRKECNFTSTEISSKHDGIPVIDMILRICPIEIIFDDPISDFLPKTICSDCLEVISAAFNLQRVSIESDQYFRSLFTQDQVVIKSEKIEEETEVKVEFPEDSFNQSDDCFDEQQSEDDTFVVPVQKRKNIIRKCKICDETFDDLKAKNHHMKMVHNKLYRELEPHEKIPSYKCCKCELNHTSESDLLKHLHVHSESFKTERTKCQFCTRNMKEFKEFLKHAKYHAIPPTHECLTCKKRLPYGEKFLKHVRNHKRSGTHKAECDHCGKKLRSLKSLEIHIKITHQKETLFMCPVCAKSLSTADALDQHIRFVHSEGTERKFQCKYCGKKFLIKARLTRHEACHSNERAHVCEICGSAFKHKEGLTKHMKKHNGTETRNHACTQCPLRFPTKYKLDQHMLTHSGLKPHECKFCDRAYASKGDLIKHMQKLHVGDAIYQCNKCPRAFRVIIELREHQLEHGSD